MAKKTTDIQTLAENWLSTKKDSDFKLLYDRLRPGIWKYVSTLEPDFDDRNSLVNYIMAKAVDKIDQYSPDKGKFSTWIYTIARNEALCEKNRKDKVTSLDALEEEGFAVKDEGHEAEAENFDIRFTMDREHILQDLYNKVINAYKDCGDKMIAEAFYKQHFENKTMKQIGEELGLCENTAKQKIFKGKKLIREILMKTDKDLIERYREENC